MKKKLTLCFDSEVINDAKAFAKANEISLSKLTEFVFQEITANKFKDISEFPIASWVEKISKGNAVYTIRNKKKLKKIYFESKRR